MAVTDGITDIIADTSIVAATENFDYQPASGDTWSVSLVYTETEGAGAGDTITVGLYDASNFAIFDVVSAPADDTVSFHVGNGGTITEKLVLTNSNYLRIQCTEVGGAGWGVVSAISGIKIVE